MTYLRFLFVVCFLISICFFGPNQEQEQWPESDADLDAVWRLPREDTVFYELWLVYGEGTLRQ